MRSKHFLFIFILALVLRLIAAFSSRGIPVNDAKGYDLRAVSIIQGKGFSEDNKPTAFKEPMYSFFLAGVYLIFGHNYLAVRVVQAVLSAWICGFIFLLGVKAFNKNIGLISGLCAALNPVFIKSAQLILTETLYTFVFLAIIFYLARLFRVVSKTDAAMFGFLAGVASLIRSAMALFVLFAIVGLWMAWKDQETKRILTASGIILLSAGMVILPWTIRNWRVFGEFVPISTNVGINMYSSYFPPEGKIFGLTANDDYTRLAATLGSEPAESKFLMHKTFERIKSLGLAKILKLELLKVAYFFAPFDWEIISSGKYNIWYGFLLPFFAFSLIACLRDFYKLIYLYLPVIYGLFLTLVTYGSPRFRMPMEPFIIIFAAWGICEFWSKFGNKVLAMAIYLGWFILQIGLYFKAAYLKEAFLKWISY